MRVLTIVVVSILHSTSMNDTGRAFASPRTSNNNNYSSNNNNSNVILDQWSWDDNEIQILGQAILLQDHQQQQPPQEERALHTDEDPVKNERESAFAAAAAAWLQDRRSHKQRQRQEEAGKSKKLENNDNNNNNTLEKNRRMQNVREWHDSSEWEVDVENEEEEYGRSSRNAVSSELNDVGIFGGGDKQPVLYRYFNRVRARRRVETSVPFILLGSGNVDHWTKLGKALSANGFNVIACELQTEDDDMKEGQHLDGPELVAAVLDALRWRKAVVVGCDKAGALAALEAEAALGAEEVAGVVLIGDLINLRSFLLEEMPELDPRHPRLLDEYLLRYVECPSTIVWDGNIATLKKKGTIEANLRFPVEAYDSLRCVVLGGGEAPHRRTPEQLAWVLTRFVEEKVVDHKSHVIKVDSRRACKSRPSESYRKNNSDTLDDFASRAILFGLDLRETIMSPESLLVSGRLIAYALMYVALGKAAVAQYRTFQSGVSAVQFSCSQLSKWQHQMFMFLSDLFLKDWQRRTRFARLIFAPLKILRLPRVNRKRGSNSSNDDERSFGVSDAPDELKERIEEEEDFPFIFRFGSSSV